MREGVLALARDVSARTDHTALLRRCSHVRSALIRDGLFDASQSGKRGVATGDDRWRIAPEPFLLSREELTFFESLGRRLLTFYRALNRLYADSVRGAQPAWVAEYLDQGKPESLVAYSRMKRFRDQLPGIIRPDIIPTESGMVITELDAVPGGIGLTGSLSRAYASLELDALELVGGANGMVEGFATMLRSLQEPGQSAQPGACAIVVSDESKDYRPEMRWLASCLSEAGLEAHCVEPRDVRFTEEVLLIRRSPESTDPEVAISVLYRFFELFDLKNVPKAELIMYGAKKGVVAVTPPFKPQLEEKLAFALLHHPMLTPFWRHELGEDDFLLLSALVPRTWILDPRPVPPSAVIPGLTLGRRPLADLRDLGQAGQKERRYVIKPSGFSELAWGSRGVSVGHDLPQTEWAAALDRALASFPTTPYVLQEFHKGRQFDLSFHDPASGEIVPMSGRARLSPYYFVSGDRAELRGVLATVCPPDKKVIHGMRDAIMVPCAVKR
jgi:hypothetical protein